SRRAASRRADDCHQANVASRGATGSTRTAAPFVSSASPARNPADAAQSQARSEFEASVAPDASPFDVRKKAGTLQSIEAVRKPLSNASMPTIGDIADPYGSSASTSPASMPGPSPKRRAVRNPHSATSSAFSPANG